MPVDFGVACNAAVVEARKKFYLMIIPIVARLVRNPFDRVTFRT